MIVYLPILTLTGIEGKMFVPMAKVVLLALLGSLILSFTFIPAMAALFLTGKVSEGDGRIMSFAKALVSTRSVGVTSVQENIYRRRGRHSC